VVATVGSGISIGSSATPTAKKTVKMVETGTDIQGRMPPEVIRRIVRANFPRFRACYEVGLKTNPSLAGTVITRFVIDNSGAVESAASGGGTLGSGTVSACVLGVFRTLSFPAPEGGKVTVTYPINFQPE
jgi:hypothetical protein